MCERIEINGLKKKLKEAEFQINYWKEKYYAEFNKQREHGYWEPKWIPGTADDYYSCSVCGSCCIESDNKYCPVCGAVMDDWFCPNGERREDAVQYKVKR